VIVHAGGCLTGDIRATHLIVEDGGGLVGRVQIGANPPAAARSGP
jgi:cytoskeletal protein CcmA (bactofilin family)